MSQVDQPRVTTPAVLTPDASVTIPARDRTALAADVYLPHQAKAGRRVPAVVFRVAYGKRGPVCQIPSMAHVLVDNGFAVVASDVRGKFDSQGARRPFAAEVEDGYDTIEWITRQSWSNHGIVAMGDSYGGYAAWAAAASGHRDLIGLIVRGTSPDVMDDWLHRQGVFRLWQNVNLAAFAWTDRTLVDDPQVEWSRRPLRALLPPDEAAQIWTAGFAAPDAPALAGIPAVDTLLSAVSVPTLHCGGWWDPFSRGQIAAWQRLRQTASHQHLRVTSTDHELNAFGRTPDARSPHGQLRLERSLSAPLAFLERLLQGSAPAPVIEWELTHAGLRRCEQWPPAGAREERLYLVDGAHAALGPEGGGLSTVADRLPSMGSWIHDPDDLVPSLEADPWATLSRIADQRDIETRPDVLTFTGPEHKIPVDLAGPVTVQVTMSSSAPSTHVVAQLVDVLPDGRAHRLLEGTAHVTKASYDEAVRIDLGSIGYRVRSGHRLRLEIASSSFPRYMWHPGSAHNPWDAIAGTASQQRLRLGGDASHLRLWTVTQ